MSEVLNKTESFEIVDPDQDASNFLQALFQGFNGEVEKIEEATLQAEQAECPVFHRFGPGTYIREVHLKAGLFAVGHHQNFKHTNIMLQGRVTVLNEDGSTVELSAPTMFVGEPGRKVGYIHEDVVWLNVYATEETDVEKLESTFLTKSDTWNLSLEHQTKILSMGKDKDDYLEMLKDLGVTEKEVRDRSEVEEDMIDLPYGHYKIKIGSSLIEGKGLKATAAIEAGEVIAPARLGEFRTIAGRYTNHSSSPNAEMVINSKGNVDLVATRQIQGCRGGLDGEEITIDYRMSFQKAREADQLEMKEKA